MTHPVLLRRRRERRAQIEVAARWAAGLAERLPVRAVVVVGSVARGDFNKWSDLDVLVIAEDLPGDARERLALLHQDAPPGLQAVGWTSAELRERQRVGDPIAEEAATVGVLVIGSRAAVTTTARPAPHDPAGRC